MATTKKKGEKNKRGNEKMPDGDSESQSAYEDIREVCEDHLKHLWNTWA